MTTGLSHVSLVALDMREIAVVTYATAGATTSETSLMCRKVYPKPAMVKSMRHIRTIQKGTRMRFFHIFGCCVVAMLSYDCDSGVLLRGGRVLIIVISMSSRKVKE